MELLPGVYLLLWGAAVLFYIINGLTKKLKSFLESIEKREVSNIEYTENH